jgi:hypothetical protein
MAQALSPFAGALLIEHFGTVPTIAALTAAALVNVTLVLALWKLCRR